MASKTLTKLEQRRAALDAQIKAAKARQKVTDRKIETRRKVLAGAAVLFHAQQDPAFNAELNRMLDSFLARADERELFDLPERTPTSAAA